MTKLRFKIKQGAKKRSHRNKVAKRRQQREKTRVENKRQEQEEHDEETFIPPARWKDLSDNLKKACKRLEVRRDFQLYKK